MNRKELTKTFMMQIERNPLVSMVLNKYDSALLGFILGGEEA